MRSSRVHQSYWRASASLTACAILAALVALGMSPSAAPLPQPGMAWAIAGLLVIALALLMLAAVAARRGVSPVAVGVEDMPSRGSDGAGPHGEEMFRSFVESAQDPMFTTDADGRYLYVNRAAAALLGRTPEEVAGKRVDDFFPPEAAANHRAVVAQALSAGGFVATDVSFELNGERFWSSLRVVPVRQPDGSMRSALVVSRDITGLKRAEKALRENEERLRQVVSLAHIGIFDHDHATGEIYWSPEQREIYGWGPDEPVISMNAPEGYRQTLDLIHPLDRERTLAAVHEAHRSEEGLFDIEYRIVLRDGTERWVSTRSQTFFESDGDTRRPVRTIGAVQDITERHRTERELRFMRTAVDTSHTAFYSITPQGQIIYANEHAARSLGIPLQKLIGSYVPEIDASGTGEVQCTLWEELRTTGVTRFETQHRRADGTLLPVEVTANLFSFGGEEQSLCFVLDITERRKAEQALRESEERLRQVALVYDIGVFDHDYLNDVVYWSPELRQCIGFPLDAPAALPMFTGMVHPEDRERTSAEVERALDPAGDGRCAFQHRIVRADGSVKWLDTRSQTFFVGEGDARRPSRTVGAVVDISSRMRTDEALRLSVREKEILLREVHHRVKNNLQIIASLLHFQAKKVKSPEDLVVFNEGRDRLRAMILVHEKLYKSEGLSRIEFGGYLQALVNDLRRSYSAAMGGRVKVQVVAEQIALPIQAALPCGMVVCELLTNAMKYAFPEEMSGEIRVTLATDDEHITLAVSDDGVGLPSGFEPERATSFGWRLVRNLAAQLGGKVTVAGRPGTQVTLQFSSERCRS